MYLFFKKITFSSNPFFQFFLNQNFWWKFQVQSSKNGWVIALDTKRILYCPNSILAHFGLYASFWPPFHLQWTSPLKGTCHSTKDTCHSAKGTCLSTKGTCHSTKGTCHSMKSTCHSTKDTHHSVKGTSHSKKVTCHSTKGTCHSKSNTPS